MTGKVVIRGGSLIDGSGADPVKNAGIYIDAGKISHIGGAEEKHRLWQGAKVVDATGMFIMPGLIDGHCHLSLHQGALPGITAPASAEFCALWAGRAAGKVLRAGVTGISVPGGKWFADVLVRDSVNAGLVEGPRIFCAGRGLTPYGGIFDTHPTWDPIPNSSAGVLCNTIDEYVRETRLQCKRGVDLVKVADSYWGDVQTITYEELSAVVGEAHRRNVKVCTHSRGSGSTRDAARAGVDWIFHADYATDEDLDAVAEAAVPIMPAFTATQVAIDSSDQLTFSQPMRDRMKAQLEINYRAIQEARKRGIPILVGSDSGNAAAFHHGMHHGVEYEILVREVGMTPMEAIVAGTKLNAQVIGLEGKVGEIKPGMLADIVMWKSNPVLDIRVLQKLEEIAMVMKDGRIIDRDREGYRDLGFEPSRVR